MLGLGRQASPFMQQMGAPPNDGEVLVIEHRSITGRVRSRLPNA